MVRGGFRGSRRRSTSGVTVSGYREKIAAGLQKSISGIALFIAFYYYCCYFYNYLYFYYFYFFYCYYYSYCTVP